MPASSIYSENSLQKEPLAPKDAVSEKEDTPWDCIVRFPAGKIDPLDLIKAREQIQRYLAKNRPLDSLGRHKPHLLLPALYELSQSAPILQGARHFLKTDDFFLWYSVLFVKEKQTPGYIPWHYDDYFWGFEAKGGCTVWVALSDVSLENGAMEFASDKTDATKIFVQFKKDNLLVRGNNSTFEPGPESEVKHVILKAGEFSVHANTAWHRSGPNRSSDDRLAVAFRFITSDAKPKKFRFLKRGGIPRVHHAFPSAFYAEEKPFKEYDPGKSWQHKKSILISTFLTSFGDAHRSFLQQLKDFFAMMITARFFKLGSDIVAALFGRDRERAAKNSVRQNMNDG